MGTSISETAEIYNLKNESFYPYEYFEDEQSRYDIYDNLTNEDFKPSLTSALPSQEEADNFNKTNRNKTGNTRKHA